MSCFAITSNHPRHMKFLETLYRQIDIPVVIVVDKGPIDQKEADYFKSNLSLLRKPNIVRCSKHQLHSNFILQTLSKMDAKVGFVFGAPILKEEIFSLPKYGCVNIHTGLVNKYRGVDSSLWALHNGDFDSIGATLHHINASIDTGDVIGMKTSEIDRFDNVDTIFYKSCQVGFNLLESHLDDIMHGKTKSIKLKNKGKLYQNKDRTTEVVKKAEKNLRSYINENYFRSL